jgi:hypothetical protein
MTFYERMESLLGTRAGQRFTPPSPHTSSSSPPSLASDRTFEEGKGRAGGKVEGQLCTKLTLTLKPFKKFLGCFPTPQKKYCHGARMHKGAFQPPQKKYCHGARCTSSRLESGARVRV